MLFTVYNDVHLGAPHEMAELFPFDDDAILNGDIVDYQNCKYHLISQHLDLIKALKRQYGDKYILGNHELESVHCRGFYKQDRVLFRHGDHEFWGEEKRDKYMTHANPGAGWVKRNLVARQFDWLRRLWTARYSNKFKERAYSSAMNENCHTIVFGHKHPRIKADFMYRGVRIIVLPRGRNIIDV
jgi:metallophosphoesterase superfamily enzyme